MEIDFSAPVKLLESLFFPPEEVDLHKKAKQGDLEGLLAELNERPHRVDEVRAHTRDSSLSSPLLIAAREGTIQCVEALLDKGADKEFRDFRGNTALILASSRGRLEVVRLLLSRGVNVNVSKNNGCTALMRAALHGHLRIVELLIEHNAHINVKANNGRSALMWAISRGHMEITQYLIEKGADVCAVDPDPDPIALKPSPESDTIGTDNASYDTLFSGDRREKGCLPDLNLRIDIGHGGTLDALQTVFNSNLEQENNAKQDVNTEEEGAGREDNSKERVRDEEETGERVGDGEDVENGGEGKNRNVEEGNRGGEINRNNGKEANGNSEDSMDKLGQNQSLLPKEHLDVNRDSLTAAGKVDENKVNHETSMNVNKRNDDEGGKDGLGTRSAGSESENEGEANDTCNGFKKPIGYGETPLMVACQCRNEAFVCFLLSKGADVNINAQNAQGKTALIIACAETQLTIVRHLLFTGPGALGDRRSNIDVNLAERDGHTALMYAVCYNSASIVRLLMQVGANASLLSEQGLSAKDMAKSRNYSHLVNLIQSFEQPDAADASTSLQVTEGASEVMENVLAAMAQVGVKSSTPSEAFPSLGTSPSSCASADEIPPSHLNSSEKAGAQNSLESLQSKSTSSSSSSSSSIFAKASSSPPKEEWKILSDDDEDFEYYRQKQNKKK